MAIPDGQEAIKYSLRPVHTVGEKCDCRRKVRLSPLSRRFLRQSHFSATVWTGLYKCCSHESLCTIRQSVYIHCGQVL